MNLAILFQFGDPKATSMHVMVMVMVMDREKDTTLFDNWVPHTK